MYDAVHLFAKALHDLDSSQRIDIKPLSCDAVDTWPHGYSLINYMKIVSIFISLKELYILMSPLSKDEILILILSRQQQCSKYIFFGEEFSRDAASFNADLIGFLIFLFWRIFSQHFMTLTVYAI